MQIEHAADSDGRHALAGLFRGQNEAFSEVRIRDVIAQKSRSCGVNPERHTNIVLLPERAFQALKQRLPGTDYERFRQVVQVRPRPDVQIIPHIESRAFLDPL